MNERIIVKDKRHLKQLIEKGIDKNGERCDLNYLDVSGVTDLSWLFWNSQFNGDISKWDVSHVENMTCIFFNNKFNGDISGWDVSQVENMVGMFEKSKFNRDLSEWNNMGLANMEDMFDNCVAPKPWWYVEVVDREERMKEVKRIGILKMKEKIESRTVKGEVRERKKTK